MYLFIYLVDKLNQCVNYNILDEADRNRNNGGCGKNGGDECHGDYPQTSSTKYTTSPKWVGSG